MKPKRTKGKTQRTGLYVYREGKTPGGRSYKASRFAGHPDVSHVSVTDRRTGAMQQMQTRRVGGKVVHKAKVMGTRVSGQRMTDRSVQHKASEYFAAPPEPIAKGWTKPAGGTRAQKKARKKK